MLKKYTFDGTRPLDLPAMNTGAKEDKVIKEEIVQKTAVNQLAIQALQDKLYADQKEGLIILFQARDAAGKDSTIKHVMSGINPQGVDVTSFKQPTDEELAHDFLWRVSRHVPRRGKIAIFNRSYYEDVLVVQVRSLHQTYMMPARITEDPKFFKKRYKQIRHYEKYLHQNGYRVVKIFLNVSRKTQKERFLERIDDPDKNWKFSQADLKERKLWDAYTSAYQDAINATATKSAPWYVIPADKKWYTRYLVSEIVRRAMEEMDPQYPAMPASQKALLSQYRQELLQEGGKPAAPKPEHPASPALTPQGQPEPDTLKPEPARAPEAGAEKPDKPEKQHKPEKPEKKPDKPDKKKKPDGRHHHAHHGNGRKKCDIPAEKAKKPQPAAAEGQASAKPDAGVSDKPQEAGPREEMRPQPDKPVTAPDTASRKKEPGAKKAGISRPDKHRRHRRHHRGKSQAAGKPAASDGKK